MRFRVPHCRPAPREHRAGRTASFRRRVGAFVAIFLLGLAMPALAYGAVISDVSGKIICQCGCGAVLDQCPHQDCGWGVPAKDFIQQQLTAGKTPDDLLRYYVSQYGQKVLAAPPKSGFNITAWVTPFALLLGGAVGIYSLVRMWAAEGRERDAGAAAPRPMDESDPLVQRLENELKKFD